MTDEDNLPAEIEEEPPNPEDINNSFRRSVEALGPPPIRGDLRNDEIIPACKAWALKARAAGYTITDIADMMKRTRQSILYWAKSDPEFNEAWSEAYQEFKERAEGEAIRRAFRGYSPKPGLIAYSDPLLKMMLQTAAPERFGEKGGGAMIQVNIGDVEAMRKNQVKVNVGEVEDGNDDDDNVIDGQDLVKELEG